MTESTEHPYEHTAPSFSAAHPEGALYMGEFETPSDGTALAVRLHALALASTGLPVLLRSFSGVVVSPEGIAEPVYLAGMPAEVEKQVGHLLTTDISIMRPVIKHAVIRGTEHCRQMLMPRGAIPLESGLDAQIAMRDAIYRNTIVYSVWERDRIDPGVAQLLARVRQCWVPCHQNALMLTKAGVPEDRVHVVPHPYAPDDLILTLSGRKPRMHDGWKRYYSIGRWEPRKGFANLIRAFLLAHEPGDRASLTIKWSGGGSWPGYVTPDAVLGEMANHVEVQLRGWSLETIQEHVRLIGGRVRREIILKLHWDNNIYVSASHGEAWGLPAFDAKLAGNRLVYVDWGGVCDFAGIDDVPVEHRLVPADASYQWEHGAQWAGYDVSDLSRALRYAEVPDTFRRDHGLEELFSLEAVGKKMRALVDLALAE